MPTTRDRPARALTRRVCAADLQELHTPLALSVYYNRHACAEALLKAGANLNLRGLARPARRSPRE
jgi:site-specific recombinase XerD